MISPVVARTFRLRAALLAWMLAVSAPGQAKKSVTVAADGSGDFRDVQAAVDAAPAAGGLVIHIRPGVYRQVLTIAKPGIELRGLGKRPQDVVLTWNNSHGTAGGTTQSASTTVSGDDFLAENLTFQNTFSVEHPEEKKDAQAVALLTLGDREVFRNVRLLGAQDTLYANSRTCHSGAAAAAAQPCRAARQFFVDSYIEGHVDFIFGDAKAVFLRCEIHAVAHPLITLTAQSRLYPAEDSGYLFLHDTVTAAPGAGSIYLGRPWRAYSTVVFIDTDFKAPLNPAGWLEWDGRLKTSSYAEFGSKGEAGDVNERVGGRVLTAAEAAKYTVAAWLGGTDGWNPEAVR